MGEWSDAMADGVICEGCACPGDTATCGCPESLAILYDRQFGRASDAGKTRAAITSSIQNPHGMNTRLGGRDDVSKMQQDILNTIRNPHGTKGDGY